MKTNIFVAFILIVIVFLSSLGCIEYTNHLSSDFTPIGTNTFYIVNDSNMSISYNCVQQKINLDFHKKYTIRGNITNIGNETIDVELNAFFFKKNNAEFDSEDNNIEPIKYRIKPKQTIEFIANQTFTKITDIRSYKITLSY